MRIGTKIKITASLDRIRELSVGEQRAELYIDKEGFINEIEQYSDTDTNDNYYCYEINISNLHPIWLEAGDFVEVQHAHSDS